MMRLECVSNEAVHKSADFIFCLLLGKPLTAAIWKKESKNSKEESTWRQFNVMPSIVPGCPGLQVGVFMLLNSISLHIFTATKASIEGAMQREKLGLTLYVAQSHVHVPGAAFGPVVAGACAGALPLQLLRASANEAWLSSSLKLPSSKEGPLNACKVSLRLVM